MWDPLLLIHQHLEARGNLFYSKATKDQTLVALIVWLMGVLNMSINNTPVFVSAVVTYKTTSGANPQGPIQQGLFL